jgi:two-component system, cell cycle response regulator DivK
MVKLLLAEDHELSRDLLARRLERQGYEVIAVADGREAIHAARKHQPDLILMDLEMPVMDGNAAIRYLKNDLHTFRIPVIVLSAHVSVENVTKAMAAGCHAYEAKPIVLSRLMERIEQALKSQPE